MVIYKLFVDIKFLLFIYYTCIRVIYKLLADIEKMIVEKLPKLIETVSVGTAKVEKVFYIYLIMYVNVCGCICVHLLLYWHLQE